MLVLLGMRFAIYTFYNRCICCIKAAWTWHTLSKCSLFVDMPKIHAYTELIGMFYKITNFLWNIKFFMYFCAQIKNNYA